MKRAALVAAAGAALAAAVAGLACTDDVRSHVYSGEQYDETRMCLEPVTSIDIVAGPAPATPCSPVCILSDATDAGPAQVFVSSMCAPYPTGYPYDSKPGSDPRCAVAIAAFDRNTLCESDGGIQNPFVDASAPDGAVVDASNASDAADGAAAASD